VLRCGDVPYRTFDIVYPASPTSYLSGHHGPLYVHGEQEYALRTAAGGLAPYTIALTAHQHKNGKTYLTILLLELIPLEVRRATAVCYHKYYTIAPQLSDYKLCHKLSRSVRFSGGVMLLHNGGYQIIVTG